MALPRVPIPSTALYQRYEQHARVFGILDDNLRISISNYYQKDGVRIRVFEDEKNYTDEHYVFKVEDVKDLTGEEVRAFNRKINEIFSEKATVFKGMVLTDGQYTF